MRDAVAEGWGEAFVHIDEMSESSRARFLAFLHRLFAASGDPRGWEGWNESDPELQEALSNAHVKWPCEPNQGQTKGAE